MGPQGAMTGLWCRGSGLPGPAQRSSALTLAHGGQLERQSLEWGQGRGPGVSSHRGCGSGLAAKALDNVSSLDAAQGSQEGVERGAVLGGPAGEQGPDRAGLVGEGVYVLRLVAQLVCQVPPGVPRRAIEQLLHFLALGRWQAAVEASVPLEGCPRTQGKSDTTRQAPFHPTPPTVHLSPWDET